MYNQISSGYEFAKKFHHAGFSEEQADILMSYGEHISQYSDKNFVSFIELEKKINILATKDDLSKLESKIDSNFKWMMGLLLPMVISTIMAAISIALKNIH